VTRLLIPEGTVSLIVFLLSFFSFFETNAGSTFSGCSFCSGWISVEEVFDRPGSLILVLFLVDRIVFISIVGAVVMISGAKTLVNRNLRGGVAKYIR